MIYLKQFNLANDEAEIIASENSKRNMTCYSSVYPFQLFPIKKFDTINLKPITILYGGNGSGKTTALNIIAQKLILQRTTPYNRSDFFDEYLNYCSYELGEDDPDMYGITTTIPAESKIITSEDVFQNILNLRKMNDILDRKREQITIDHHKENEPLNRVTKIDFSSPSSIAAFNKNMEARRNSKSIYIKNRIGKSIVTQSNGEVSFNYFISTLQPEALYLIDEPENSLSPKWQMELAAHIEMMTRYERCQFIIATHSPFFMSMTPSIIYNLDEQPVKTQAWHELENMKMYYDFFQFHSHEFEDGLF